jgi:pre-mRNA-splicing helicase BRR2
MRLFNGLNVFIGTPTGNGETICANFVLLRLWSKQEPPCTIFIKSYQEMVELRVNKWKTKFENLQGGKEAISLTGKTSADLSLLEEGYVIVCTLTQVC